MKRTFCLWALLAVVCFVGCEDNDAPVLPPELKLDSNLVEIANAGGDAKITYQLENAVEGVSVQVQSLATWISDFDVSRKGVISFRVAANEVPEAREALVEVSYKGLEKNQSFTVKQEAAVLPPNLKLSTQVVEASEAGGAYEVLYELEHPVEGSVVSAATTATWITDLDTSVEGKITFQVSVNEVDEVREALVEVSYSGMEGTPTFTVKQAAAVLPPSLKVLTEKVEASVQGGDFEVAYQLEHPVAGESVQASTTVDWITGFDFSTEGKVKFNVAENTSYQSREATVLLSYTGLEQDVPFTVTQEAAEAFQITLENETTNSFEMTLIPADRTMSYMYHVITVETAQIYPTDDALYEYDLDFYRDMDAGVGLGWQAWAYDDLHKGSIANSVITSMVPDTEYLVYAYGVDPETIERITPIARATIKTKPTVKLDVKFNIELVSDQASGVEAIVRAENYDGYFVAKIYSNVKDGDTDATILEKISNYWVDEVRTSGWIGYTNEQILAQHAAKNQKTVTKEVEANKVCYVYAFAVDDQALRCSDITILKVNAK